MSSEKPSFHKEGKSTIKITTNDCKNNSSNRPKGKPQSSTKSSPFVEELVQTGRPNWKKAPPQIKQRYKGIYLVLLSIPVLGVTSFEMYRRLEGRSAKKIQQGERLPNGMNRDFDEEEKIKVEQNSLMYRIFGRDFFTEGFTSQTRKPNVEKKG